MLIFSVIWYRVVWFSGIENLKLCYIKLTLQTFNDVCYFKLKFPRCVKITIEAAVFTKLFLKASYKGIYILTDIAKKYT